MNYTKGTNGNLKKNTSCVVVQHDAGLCTDLILYNNLPFPKFEKPKVLGFFSVTGESRCYEPSVKQLRYYRAPDINRFPLDLNVGLCSAKEKTEFAYDEKLDNLLKFIYDERKRLFIPTSEMISRPRLIAEFVCWRGLLRLLMCTPYETRDDWSVYITRYNDTFYLCKCDTAADKLKRANATKHQKAMSFWGFKFEQYCLLESPCADIEFNNTPVDECSEFVGVFKSNIGGADVLYGAEMDGIIRDQAVKLDTKQIEDLKFIELKVRQGNLNAKQQHNFDRFKTRDWWCQSFLVGIEDIYVGMRSEKGFVQKIDRMDVRSLPKQGANFWTPTTCANFLKQFFMRVRIIMSGINCPYTTYKFHFNAELASITYESVKDKNECSFLPDWYIAVFQQ